MKIIIKLILILNFYLIFPQNIIVDQSSLNQYDKDNYIHFNSFAYYGKFSGNVGKTPPIPLPTDRINLPNTFPVLGNQFTLEAMFYSKPNPLLTSKGIIGGDAPPSKIKNESPPTITLNKQNGVNQIRYGFGIGPDSKRKTFKIIRK